MNELHLFLPALIGCILTFFPQTFFKPKPLVLNYERKTAAVRRVGLAMLAGTALGLLLIRFAAI